MTWWVPPESIRNMRAASLASRGLPRISSGMTTMVSAPRTESRCATDAGLSWSKIALAFCARRVTKAMGFSSGSRSSEILAGTPILKSYPA